MEAVVGHRHGLGEALGLVVHAARADRVDVAPVVLALRMDERIAVDLGGGGEQEARLLGLGQAERVVRAEAADLERLDRHAQVVDGGGRAREVEDAVERALEVDVVRDVVLHEHEVAAGQVLDVRHVAGDQVVHADDGVAVVEQVLGEVRAEEAGGAGDESARHQ